ncbi:MAG: hypothetical protein ABL958_02580 [Bdellovibrionia bacterium]
MTIPSPAKADAWGADIPILLEILANAIKQLVQMQEIVSIAQGDSNLLKRVNKDIEHALTEIRAMQTLVRDTTEIGKSKDPQEILWRLRNVYGQLPRIGDLAGFTFNDNVAGTGLAVDNDTHIHASNIDQAAVNLQKQAVSASPGRAQQLTAQSQTTILHSLAQLERSNATLIRVASAELAIENGREKNRIRSFEEGFRGVLDSKANKKSNLTLKGLNYWIRQNFYPLQKNSIAKWCKSLGCCWVQRFYSHGLSIISRLRFSHRHLD